MALADMPFLITEMYKQKTDEIMWGIWLHKYDGKLSYAEYKKETLAQVGGSGLTSEEKAEQHKEALDFAAQFIKFADPQEG